MVAGNATWEAARIATCMAWSADESTCTMYRSNVAARWERCRQSPSHTVLWARWAAAAPSPPAVKQHARADRPQNRVGLSVDMKDKAAGLPGQGRGASTPPFLVSAATAAALAPDFPDLSNENIKTELPRLLQEIVSPSSAARQEAVSARRRHVLSAGALSGPARSLPACAP